MTEVYSSSEIKSHFDNMPFENMAMFTFTLKPKLYVYQTLTQYEITINDIKQLIARFAQRYALSVEVTQAGNIHYHAIISFNTLYHRVGFINKVRAKRILGFYHISPDINELTDLVKTIVYITKSIETTQKILHKKNYKPEIISLG